MTYHYLRTTLLVGAAAVAFGAPRTNAQSFGQNLFAGPDTVVPTSISTTNATVSVGQTNSGLIGPGYTATVALGAGALDTLTESIDAGSFGALTALESGQGVTVAGIPINLGVGGTFSAAKDLPEHFTPSQRYMFTLTTTSNAALNLLSGANVTFSTVDNGSTTVVDTLSSGSGLLGIVQVLNLFGGGNTMSFGFTAPANVDTAVPITFTVNGGLTAGALGNSFTFTSATLMPVPEPNVVNALGVSLTVLVWGRFRRRLRI